MFKSVVKQTKNPYLTSACVVLRGRQ